MRTQASKGGDPLNPSGAKTQFGQGWEEEIPFNIVKCFFKIEEYKDKVLVTLCCPDYSLLSQEIII
jgi:hypothetical protein